MLLFSLILSPHLTSKAAGIRANAIAREVVADALDIAQEQSINSPVLTRIYCLCEVDDTECTVPVQDIVLGEVAMNAVA